MIHCTRPICLMLTFVTADKAFAGILGRLKTFFGRTARVLLIDRSSSSTVAELSALSIGRTVDGRVPAADRQRQAAPLGCSSKGAFKDRVAHCRSARSEVSACAGIPSRRSALPLAPNSRDSRREGRAPPGHGGGHGRRPSAPHAGTRATADPFRPIFKKKKKIPEFQVSSSLGRRPRPSASVNGLTADSAGRRGNP